MKTFPKPQPVVTVLALATLIALILASRSARAAGPTLTASLAVNSTADAVDVNPGNGTCATAGGDCTLRAAIQEANALPGDDIILLPSGTYTLTLTGAGDDTAAAGDLDLTSNVVISATGTTKPVIDGNGSVLNERVFHVTGAFTVTISGLVIQNGNAVSASGGGIFINTGGNLTLDNSTLSGNRADCLGSADQLSWPSLPRWVYAGSGGALGVLDVALVYPLPAASPGARPGHGGVWGHAVHHCDAGGA